MLIEIQHQNENKIAKQKKYCRLESFHSLSVSSTMMLKMLAALVLISSVEARPKTIFWLCLGLVIG